MDGWTIDRYADKWMDIQMLILNPAKAGATKKKQHLSGALKLLKENELTEASTCGPSTVLPSSSGPQLKYGMNIP